MRKAAMINGRPFLFFGGGGPAEPLSCHYPSVWPLLLQGLEITVLALVLNGLQKLPDGGPTSVVARHT